MTQSTKRTLKVLAVPAAPALITLALLVLVLSGPQESPAAAEAAIDNGTEPSLESGLRRAPEVEEILADPVVTAAVATPRDERPLVSQVRVKQVSMDDARRAAGLPPVMTELGQADSYRPPTPAEQVDPLMSAVYRLDRQVHQEKWLARHNEHEVARFLADAERATDAEERALLERSAVEHQRRARVHEAKMRKLRAQRALLTGQASVPTGGQP